MTQTVRKKYATVALVALLVTALDQITKVIICQMLPLHARIEVVQNYFNIIHIRNAGVAFGLFKGFGSQYKALSLILVVAVTLFLFGFLIAQMKKEPWLQTIGLALILGGAIGNLIDRFRLGEVVDFLDVHWRNLYHWPAFNVADSAITVGIILVIICELFVHKHRRQTDIKKE